MTGTTPGKMLMKVWKKCRDENDGKIAEELLPDTGENEGEYATVFKLFATKLCVPSMVGQPEWKKKRGNVLFSNIVTMADESLALLVLESRFDAWLNMVRNEEHVQRQEKTDEGANVSGVTVGNKRYNEYKGNGAIQSEERLKRFGEIMRVVIRSRRNSSKNGRRKWEEREMENFSLRGRIVKVGNDGRNEECKDDTLSSALLVAYEFEKGGK